MNVNVIRNLFHVDATRVNRRLRQYGSHLDDICLQIVYDIYAQTLIFLYDYALGLFVEKKALTS